MDRLTLSAPAREAIAAHVAARYPEEACGLLFGRQDEGSDDAGACIVVEVAEPRANVAPADQRRHAFLIDPRELMHAPHRSPAGPRVAPLEMVGFFHSHPDSEARPSRADMDFVRLWPGTAWVIVMVRAGEPGRPRAWWLESPHAEAPRELVVGSPEEAATGEG